MTSPRVRWVLLLGLLAGSAYLVLTDEGGQPVPGVVEATPARAPSSPSSRPADTSEPAAAENEPVVLALRERKPPPDPGEAFANRDWRPPPPKAAEPPPPPPPTAPPLPYTVLGKKLEDGQWQVFLARGERVFVVKAADTLDNVYRVGDIRPPVMTLTYLPLQQEQRLSIGGPQ